MKTDYKNNRHPGYYLKADTWEKVLKIVDELNREIDQEETNNLDQDNADSYQQLQLDLPIDE